MAWVLSDPTSTEWAVLTDRDGKPIPDSPRFLLGFWPPSKAAQLEARIDSVREVASDRRAKLEAEGAGLGLSGDALEAFVRDGFRKAQPTELAAEEHEAWSEMVRWSLRGWEGINGPDGKPIEFKSRKVQLDGMEHVEALPESLWVLKSNRILAAVGTKASIFNSLPPEEKKTCGWLSPS